jgi:choline-sulfatase
MIIAGPGIPQGRAVSQIASHVDLYPTIVEGVGETLRDPERSLPGTSLWAAINGHEVARTGFAEYHAVGSRSAGFMLRQGNDKLIYHAGMPPQLFDLAADPDETRDCIADRSNLHRAAELEGVLRTMLDPEDTDRRAKADQLRKAQEYGGKEGILKLRGGFVYSPPPGVDWREA